MSNNLNDLLIKLDSLNDPSVPPWALLLIESFKVLIGEFKSLTDVNKRVSVLEDLNATCQNTSNLLKTENERLQKELINLHDRVDDHEQRNRNYCLLVHGVEECDETFKEDTDDIALAVFRDELGIDIGLEDIERSHRLGPFDKKKRNLRSAKKSSRPIIVRFKSIRKRHEVFKNKRSLKGKPISISENLTKHRYAIYKAALEKFGRNKVWTYEGRVTTKVGEKYIVINSMDDLN